MKPNANGAAEQLQAVDMETFPKPESSTCSVHQNAGQRKLGESMTAITLKIREGGKPDDEEVIIEVDFLDEAPSESIQPAGFNRVARICYPALTKEFCQYFVAKDSGLVLDVTAWDEEDGPHGEVMDSWYEQTPFNFRNMVINSVLSHDPIDWIKATNPEEKS